MTQPPPTNLLLEFVVSLLTPFLLTAEITDTALARRAVQQAIAAYQATAQDQLVSITQIVAFAITAVDNLRLSLPAELSLNMKMQLRGSASALNRAAARASATLQIQRQIAPPAAAPDQTPAPDQTEVLADLEATRSILETPRPATRDRAWAQAMTDVAAEYRAELPGLPPAQQGIHLARINALSGIARQLATGTAPPLKARLLTSTALLTSNFAAHPNPAARPSPP